jgi:hypothetical protein
MEALLGVGITRVWFDPIATMAAAPAPAAAPVRTPYSDLSASTRMSLVPPDTERRVHPDDVALWAMSELLDIYNGMIAKHKLPIRPAIKFASRTEGMHRIANLVAKYGITPEGITVFKPSKLKHVRLNRSGRVRNRSLTGAGIKTIMEHYEQGATFTNRDAINWFVAKGFSPTSVASRLSEAKKAGLVEDAGRSTFRFLKQLPDVTGHQRPHWTTRGSASMHFVKENNFDVVVDNMIKEERVNTNAS